MIVPDVNLLIYAHDSTAPQHSDAKAWWEQTLSGSEPVGIPWIVALAFVRLMTHPTLSDNPMTISQARDRVEGWLAVDHVRLLSPTSETLSHFFNLLGQAGVGGNLCTDAMIAALAVEYGARVHTNDADFGRFSGVVWRNPLAD